MTEDVYLITTILLYCTEVYCITNLKAFGLPRIKRKRPSPKLDIYFI